MKYVLPEDLASLRSGFPAVVMREIVAEVSAATGVPVETIMSRDCTIYAVRPRDVAIWIAQRQGLSHMAIARAMGRDHTSIGSALHRERKRRAEMLTPPE